MAKYTVQKTTSHTMKMVIEAENEKEALHIQGPKISIIMA